MLVLIGVYYHYIPYAVKLFSKFAAITLMTVHHHPRQESGTP